MRRSRKPLRCQSLRGFESLPLRFDPITTSATPEIEEIAEDIDIDFVQEDLPKLLQSMTIGAERIRDIILALRNFS